ncbi:MAG: penicillin-binding protein 2 [Planctomycetota bacterium]
MAGAGDTERRDMSPPPPLDTSAAWRATAFLGLICICLLALGGRLAQLQLLRESRFERLARRQQAVTRDLAASRGDIVSADGQLLATDVQRKSIFADPTQVQNPDITARLLARSLDVDRTELEKDLQKTDRLFVWVKRQVSDRKAELVRDLDLPGIHLRNEQKRVYPNGRLAAHVVGFTDIDGRGLSGLEMEFDELLRGEPGQEVVRRDGLQRLLRSPYYGRVTPPYPGANLRVTLDTYIQSVAEQELHAAVSRHNPESAVALVMDPHTGDILAMASSPRFDPNQPGRSPASARKNRAVSAVYEFGSVLKPITVASALDAGAVTPDTTFHCHGGAWRIGGRTVHDAHGYGRLTVKEIVENSSNIGAAQIGMELGKRRFYAHLKDLGFGRPTGIRLPGEVSGMLRPVSRWNRYSIVSISFGQELAITPLNITRAFCSIANGGWVVQPRLARRAVRSESRKVAFAQSAPKRERRVFSRETTRQVREMMQMVVDSGTGTEAQLEKYTVGGKTGTAQLLRPDGSGYSHSRFLASFVAMAPVSDPQLVVLVSLKNPRKNGYYGGVAAAPACGDILQRTLDYLKVPPDKQPDEESEPTRELAQTP